MENEEENEVHEIVSNNSEKSENQNIVELPETEDDSNQNYNFDSLGKTVQESKDVLEDVSAVDDELLLPRASAESDNDKEVDSNQESEDEAKIFHPNITSTEDVLSEKSNSRSSSTNPREEAEESENDTEDENEVEEEEKEDVLSENKSTTRSLSESQKSDTESVQGEKKSFKQLRLDSEASAHLEKLQQVETLAESRKNTIKILNEQLSEKDLRIESLEKQTLKLNSMLGDIEESKLENKETVVRLEGENLGLKTKLSLLEVDKEKLESDILSLKGSVAQNKAKIVEQSGVYEEKIAVLKNSMVSSQEQIEAERNESTRLQNDLEEKLARESAKREVAESVRKKLEERVSGLLVELKSSSQQATEVQKIVDEMNSKFNQEKTALHEKFAKQLSAAKREAEDRYENFTLQQRMSGVQEQFGEGQLSKTMLYDEIYKLRKENRGLRREYDLVVTKIEEDAPKVNALKEDYDAMLVDFETISKAFEKAKFDRARLEHEKSDLLRKKKIWETEKLQLNQSKLDLVAQLENLLKRQENIDYVLNHPEDHISADEVISQNLVKYSSVEELVRKNYELLATSRKLAATLEAWEDEKNHEAKTSEQVKFLTENLVKLKNQRQDQERTIDAITKQRESYKAALEDLKESRQGASSQLKALQDSFEAAEAKRISLQTKVQSLELELKNTERMLENSKNRVGSLSEELSGKKSLLETVNTETRLKDIEIQKLINELKKLEINKDELQEKIRDLKLTGDNSEMRKKQLEGELRQKTISLNVKEKHCSLLEQRISDLKQQNLDQMAMLRSIDSLSSGNRSIERENIEKLQDTISILKSEVTGKETRIVSLQQELEMSKSHANLSNMKLQKLEVTLRGKIDQTSNQNQELTQKLAVAESNLSTTREQLEQANSLNKDIRLLNVTSARAALDDSAPASSQELTVEKVALEKEVEDLKEQAEKFKEIASSHESALENLRSLTADEKADLEAKVQELEFANSTMKTKLAELTGLQERFSTTLNELETSRAECQNLGIELNRLKNDHTTVVSANETDRQEIEAKLLSLEGVQSQFNTLRDTHKALKLELQETKTRLENAAAQSDSKLLDLESTLQTLKTEREELNLAKLNLEKQLSGLRSEFKRLTRALKQSKGQEEDTGLQQDVDATVQPALTDLLELANDEVEGLKGQLLQAKDEVKLYKTRVDEVTAELEDTKLLSEEVENRLKVFTSGGLQEKVEGLEKHNRALLEMQEEAQITQAKLNKEKQALLMQIEEVKAQLEDVKLQLQSKTRALESSTAKQTEVASLQEEKTKLSQECQSLHKKVQVLEASQEKKDAQVKKHSEVIARLKQTALRYADRVKNLQKTIDGLKAQKIEPEVAEEKEASVEKQANTSNIAAEPAAPQSAVTVSSGLDKAEQLKQMLMMKQKKKATIPTTGPVINLSEESEIEKRNKRKVRFEQTSSAKKPKTEGEETNDENHNTEDSTS
eukprot:augustus_masked-scaffold_1-processed-gene-30.8-mRNA-1 protein AED:1.00 eAED:1.00 QI:0/-1/0/0/-1/1/1/0/1468